MRRRVRKRSTRRFPYAILYSFSHGVIYVIAIGDLRRHPNWWRHRLKFLP